MLKQLPFLSDMHLDYYARYPRAEAKPAPAFISDYGDMLDHLFADISDALGAVASIVSLTHAASRRPGQAHCRQ